MDRAQIAILASGNGTNAEQIIQYFKDHPNVTVGLVLTNNPKAGVLERARNHGVPAKVFSREEFRDPQVILQWLKQYEISHIVLAGFLWLIPDFLIQSFPNHIVNIHPALLPRHGGKGMYGIKVHEAVKASADTETGITIHLVNEHYDEGKILFQASCPVSETHTAEDIAACVHELEYEHYPKVIEQWISESNKR